MHVCMHACLCRRTVVAPMSFRKFKDEGPGAPPPYPGPPLRPLGEVEMNGGDKARAGAAGAGTAILCACNLHALSSEMKCLPSMGRVLFCRSR